MFPRRTSLSLYSCTSGIAKCTLGSLYHGGAVSSTSSLFTAATGSSLSTSERIPSFVQTFQRNQGVQSHFYSTFKGQTTESESDVADMKPLFSKIIIANRGEIACRIIRTCRKLGIQTVAIYSEADRNSQFVKMADEAYLVGPAESAKSYLNVEKIIDVIQKSGAQALHPGYGFLSENSSFSRRLRDAGIVFIGPSEYALEKMGDKKASKEIMEDAGVATVPGYHGTDQDPALLKEEAAKIGYPVMVKAVMGGGGKGMRLVESEQEFDSALKAAQNEARNSFGDDRVLIEKFIKRPRHVELQVFGDSHGNYVYVFERDCSVQRRMQKIIEEAPAPGLSPELRRQMGESAVNAARAVNYEGAGTVEFIMDLDTDQYYFMEMNTRLQVEHPISEMVSGQDFVEWQLLVASGNKLPLTQQQLKCNGHAFEARIYAENPKFNRETGKVEFLPATGKLHYLRTPEEDLERKVVRVDTGVVEGDEVSIYYDPMIAKLCVHGATRDIALKKLKYCLDDYHIAGVPTNIPFLKALATNRDFQDVKLDTNFIPNHKKELFDAVESKIPFAEAFAAAAVVSRVAESNRNNLTVEDSTNPFVRLGGFRVNGEVTQTIEFVSPYEFTVDVRFNNRKPDSYEFTIRKPDEEPEVVQVSGLSINTQTWELKGFFNGVKKVSNTFIKDDEIHVFTRDGSSILKLQRESIGEHEAASEGTLISPMPGKIVDVHVKVGDWVKKDQPLLVLEAMKMQNTINAPRAGRVNMIMAVEDLVGADQVLCEIVEEDEKKE